MCTPSAKFDPLDIDDIALTIKRAINSELKESEIKLNNQIKDIISLLCYLVF